MKLKYKDKTHELNAPLKEFEVKKYDDETFWLIYQSEEFHREFENTVYPLPYSSEPYHEEAIYKGIYPFDKTKGVDFYNSLNLTRIVDYLDSYFNGKMDGHKRRIIGMITYYKSCELRMYQIHLKQVQFIEEIFKKSGVKIKYNINFDLSYDSDNF